LGDLTPESLSPLQLIERYFQGLEAEPRRLAELLERAADILGEAESKE